MCQGLHLTCFVLDEVHEHVFNSGVRLCREADAFYDRSDARGLVWDDSVFVERKTSYTWEGEVLVLVEELGQEGVDFHGQLVLGTKYKLIILMQIARSICIFAEMSRMLTPDEKRFMEYWRANRLAEKRSFRQWLIGLPIGLLFGIPILLNLVSGWYKRATMWANSHSGDSSMVVLMVAVLLIASFFAIFYKKHRWDQHEQHFRELEAKEAEETQNIHKEIKTP